MLPSPDDKLHEEKLRYQLILSRDLAEQRIPQSQWTVGTPGQTQPKAVVSDATFPS